VLLVNTTVVTPTIAPRWDMLRQAGDSVRAQTTPARWLVVEDVDHAGADVTRQRGLEMVDTPWVAFLDDDDLLMPWHLEHLHRHAAATDADFVYSWFETMPPGGDPFPPSHFLNEFDPADPVETTITVLVRTELAQEVGFHRIPERLHNTGEDRAFTLGCLAAGARITHLVERTWYWRHHGYSLPGQPGNTSGLGDRW
jgi:hypothetical protein